MITKDITDVEKLFKILVVKVNIPRNSAAYLIIPLIK